MCLIRMAMVHITRWWRHQMETFFALLAICAGNSPVPVISPHKGQWRGALMFSLICVWINDWVNNREAGDLRRYRSHYDVIVMKWKHRAPSKNGCNFEHNRFKFLSCAENFVFWYKFHWNLFPNPINIKLPLIPIMAWHLFGAKPFSEPLVVLFYWRMYESRSPASRSRPINQSVCYLHTRATQNYHRA